MVRAVIFDVDGTLVDSVDLHAECWRQALSKYGAEVSFGAVRSQIGKGGDQLMPVFLPTELIERQGDEIEAFRAALFKKSFLPKVKPFPQVKELFERLRRDGTWLALASSAKGPELEIYKKLTGIERLVDLEVSADDVEHSKPCPDIFDAALRRLDPLRSGEVLVVGDTPYDALGASRAGLRTVGVLCGGFPKSSLLEAGCIAIYHDPSDLLANYSTSPVCSEARSSD